VEWDARIVLEIGGLLFALMVQGFTIYRFIMRAVHDGDNELHGRINKVKDDYVTREEFLRHMQHVESTVDKTQTIVMRMATDLNSRFDNLMLRLTNTGKNVKIREEQD